MENINDYKGMTVNEMLYVSGKIYDFDLAVKQKDVSKLKLILKSLPISEDDIQAIVKSVV